MQPARRVAPTRRADAPGAQQHNGSRQTRGCVWVNHADLRNVLQKVPAGYTLVPVVPGTDISLDKPVIIEAESGAKRQRQRGHGGEEVRASPAVS